MRKLLLFIYFTFISILLIQPSFAKQALDTEKLDRFFSSLAENNRFMGSVTVMQGDDPVFDNAYGIIDSEGSQALPESIYRVGSITKTYTAVMILQLAEQGKLSLDSRLSEYIPELPNAGNITIEQLLRHQSGLFNFTNQPDYLQYHTEPQTRDQLLARFIDAGTSFEPGAGTEYSNTAYVTLGFIIEDVTGKSYAEAFQQMISEPLGFTATYIPTGIKPADGEAESFNFTDSDWKKQPVTDMSIPGAAGAIASTAAETAAFYKALLDGELIAKESLEKMTTFEGPFGMGILRFPFGEKIAFGHNGGIDGFQSNAAVFKDESISFAILSNGVNYSFNDILIGMLSITFGYDYDIPDFAIRESLDFTAEELQVYTGTFSSPDFPLKISLFTENGELKAQAEGQGAFPLTIVEARTMIFEPAGIELVFEETEGVRFNAFNFSQAGMSFRFTLEEQDY